MQSDDSPVTPHYLDLTAAFVAPAKQLSYHQLNLRPGAKLLDVACGAGIDALGLVPYVGPKGHVTGVDVKTEMVEEARRRAASAGLSGRVDFKCGDVMGLPFEDGTFDAVRAERLLMHVENPAAALAEMVRVTRLGGRVAVLETDFGSHSVDVDREDLEVQDALLRVLPEKILTSGYSGRQLFGLMAQARLAEISVTIVPLCFTEYDQWRAIVIMDTVEMKAVAAGLEQEKIDAWHQGMRTRADSGTFFASLSMILVAGTRV
jgi:SAM-dependent methyltransferase